jgi:hypothetical protein
MASFWLNLSSPPLQPVSGPTRYYAMIDAAQVERFSQRLNLKGATLLGRVALFGDPIAPDRFDATPHLFELSNPSAYAMLARRLSQADASHGALTLLVSHLDFPELTTRLKRRMDVKLQDDVDCVNRFFDGRITPHLHACLSDEQRTTFFSVAEQWLLVGHDHEWRALTCHCTDEDPFVGPLILNARQEAYLIDHCYPYALIEHFERTDPELLDTVESKQRYQFFLKAIEAAARYNIEGSSDITLFCTLSLTRGAGFHEEAPWAEKLQAIRAGTASLQQILKSIHD